MTASTPDVEFVASAPDGSALDSLAENLDADRNCNPERSENSLLPRGLQRSSQASTFKVRLKYDKTFKVMAVRRFKRRWWGIRGPGARAQAVAIFVVLILCAIASAFYWQHTTRRAVEGSSGEETETYFELPLSTVVACAICGLTLLFLEAFWGVHWLFRRLFYIYVFLLIMQLGITGRITTMWMGQIDVDKHSGPHQNYALALDVFWAVCWVITLVLYAMGRRYGRFAKRGQFFFRNVQRSFNIRPADSAAAFASQCCRSMSSGASHAGDMAASSVRRWRFIYRPVEPQGWRPPWPFARWLGRDAMFEYFGEVNAQGRPHGLGRWMDTQDHGESLKGYWDDGLPVGPFRSIEQGSGCAHRATRSGDSQIAISQTCTPPRHDTVTAPQRPRNDSQIGAPPFHVSPLQHHVAAAAQRDVLPPLPQGARNPLIAPSLPHRQQTGAAASGSAWPRAAPNWTPA